MIKIEESGKVGKTEAHVKEERIIYDKCVVCDRTTPERNDKPIGLRSYYVEGSGQLCEKCYVGIYGTFLF